MTEEQKIMMENLPKQEDFKKGMSTTSKVLIGVGAVAILGTVAYVALKKPIWSTKFI